MPGLRAALTPASGRARAVLRRVGPVRTAHEPQTEPIRAVLTQSRPRLGARRAQTGVIHSGFMKSGDPRLPDTATFRNPSRSPRPAAAGSVSSGGRGGWVVGFGRWCRVVGATPTAESAAGPGRYTWQSTATGRVTVRRPRREPPPGPPAANSRREHPASRPGYTPRAAEHHNGRARQPPGTPARPPRLHPPRRRAPQRPGIAPPGTPGRPPRLHPPHGRAPQRPTGVGGMTRHRHPLHPVPTPTPCRGRRAEPLELPPARSHYPPCVPCGYPRCRGARHHAYRSDP